MFHIWDYSVILKNMYPKFGIEVRLNMKKAFTLAEVLITLMTIGIVAALTIPSVITNYQKMQTETKLKKVYQTLANMIELAKADNGDPLNWDWSETYNSECNSPEKIVGIFNKYLNIAQEFPKEYGCFKSHDAKLLNGELADSKYRYALADGTLIHFIAGGYAWNDDPWMWIQFDINGLDKPNTYGKDIFNIFFYAKRGLDSADWVSDFTSYKNRSREDVIESCKSSYISTYCFDLIKDNGWKIPDDYPW